MIAEKNEILILQMSQREMDMPRYQFKAADGVGASKYNIALLSTSRRAIDMKNTVGENSALKIMDTITISMHNTGWLRQCLHA